VLGYLGRCLTHLIVTVIGIVTVAFFLMRAIPGDPAQYMLGDYATKEALAALRAQLGLDRSLADQYLLFVGRAVRGDLGTSVATGQAALTEIIDSLPSSLALAVAGLAVAIALGVPSGVAAAVRQGTWLDVVIMLVSLGGISFPVFWLGLAAILLFSHKLGIFPALGSSSASDWVTQLHHLILPALVLGFSVAAYIARLTRSAMLEVLGQDYVRVARAMGVPERRVVYRLALRNALVPILAVIGVTFAWSLGNAILIEAVFSRPGVGSTMLKAILARDYQLVQAGVLALAVGVVLTNTVLDVTYGIIDPRLRAS
jgi:peptide/nickel transport system permease protein